MAPSSDETSFINRRCEQRRKAEKYLSVEFNLGGAVPIYQFGLKDISESGACILVRKGSDILKHLTVGQVLNLKFYEHGLYHPATMLKSEIRHITEGKPGRNKELVMIGIRILEKSDRNNHLPKEH